MTFKDKFVTSALTRANSHVSLLVIKHKEFSFATPIIINSKEGLNFQMKDLSQYYVNKITQMRRTIFADITKAIDV